MTVKLIAAVPRPRHEPARSYRDLQIGPLLQAHAQHLIVSRRIVIGSGAVFEQFRRAAVGVTTTW